MDYKGQARQDEFVCLVNNFKKDGYFVEIGANDPIHHNNTYVLEKNLNWKGLMVEYISGWYSHYRDIRPNSIPIINDATIVDYLKYLEDYNFPKNIDYLQIDLDVDNRSTLTTLELFDKTIFDKYTFSTITFEHDIYTGNFFDTQKISREIFSRRGYILLFSNVSVWWADKWSEFEDWYIHSSTLNKELIDKILNDSENVSGLKFETCIQILKRYLITI
jgi:hypothetical protein